MREKIQIQLLKNLLEEITHKYDEFIEEQEKELKEIKLESNKEPLTGLYNRKFVFNINKIWIEENRRKNFSFALVFIDLDNFKPINDSFGHEEGDKVLKEVASILKKNFRERDFIIRLGGDEFIVLIDLQNTHINNIEKMIESLRKKIEEKLGKYNLSFSYGIAIYPQDGKDLSTLLEKADIRMYEQKKKRKLKLN
ncbi:MAG TPA: GGDEF domain-containing protein [Nautiliaceae bacterium]|nr:GGDEF domain-containing protein [Nautiliaceae bacterium]